jgi:hypothetical protein
VISEVEEFGPACCGYTATPTGRLVALGRSVEDKRTHAVLLFLIVFVLQTSQVVIFIQAKAQNA